MPLCIAVWILFVFLVSSWVVHFKFVWKTIAYTTFLSLTNSVDKDNPIAGSAPFCFANIWITQMFMISVNERSKGT